MPTGAWRWTPRFGMCKPCENKPANAYYTQKAADRSGCPYQCEAGVEPVEVNPYCENALHVQIHRVGGARNSLIIVASSFLLLLVTWISLIYQSGKNITV